MSWDPKTYLAFGDERTRAAADLLARVAIEAPDHVADLGCGPGNSTALLAARWPRARIDGVDNSPAMIEKARTTPIAARWIEADVASWAPDAPCDVIYANATFQWVANHETLFPRLMSHVAPQGTFAFQVPRNFHEPSHAIAQEIAGETRWREKLAHVREWWNVLEPEAYYALLEPIAERIDIWETRYMQALEGDDAVYRWALGTGLRPYRDALEGEEREVFLAEYKRRAALAYPRRANGVTLFPFQRLFCIATRR